MMSDDGPEDIGLTDEEIERAQGGGVSTMHIIKDELVPEMGTSEDPDLDGREV